MHDEIVPAIVQDLAAALARPTPMRRGSVAERAMKCGHKQCRCHQDPRARHGPYYSLTRMEGGKTRSRYLSAEQAALARQQIEAGQAFRDHLEAYWRACEQWADVGLEDSGATRSEGAKKGASQRPLQRRLPPKSKHL
jgi:hypothetical protein